MSTLILRRWHLNPEGTRGHALTSRLSSFPLDDFAHRRTVYAHLARRLPSCNRIPGMPGAWRRRAAAGRVAHAPNITPGNSILSGRALIQGYYPETVMSRPGPNVATNQ